MNFSLIFIRMFFVIISIFLMTTYTTSALETLSFNNIFNGIVYGSVVSCILIALDILLSKFRLRSFNIIVIGTFLGYLLGIGVTSVFDSVFSFISPVFFSEVAAIVHTFIMLVCVYLGIIITCRSSEELSISIPFVKMQTTNKKYRDFIVTSSLLCDSRIIDLAASGFFDNRFIVPRFVIQELHNQIKSTDEQTKKKNHHGIDNLRKLETMPNLNLIFDDTYFPEAKTYNQKLIKLAKALSANIVSSDITDLHIDLSGDSKLINIQSLANAFKPLLTANEMISIKIQRYGKEPRQGVGYLDDGTMVVINGGGEHIGQVIKAQVLSVKHTSSGRIIFCNASDIYESEFLKKGITPPEQQQTIKDFLSV